MNSTLGAVPAGVFFYNNNDQLTTDTYDANGNTTASAGITSTYDFENHMVQKGAVAIVYDGDGNRVTETVGGVTTKYLVDTQNPTGYAQVVEELQNGAVAKSYSYGLERISQNWQPTAGNWQRAFYGYDGHGSVRFLTSSAGTVTDTYDYDAFGNLTNQTGSTPNNYLFAGEAYDSTLGLYYNRARYLNTSTGRFWSMDSYEGDPSSPTSLHKYVYANGNPSDLIDRSGRQVDEVVASIGISATLGGLSGFAVTGSLKGFFLGAAGGGALGVACTSVALCGRSVVSGVLNVVFQAAANLYEDYYDRTLGLPEPSNQKELESLVAAFASGAATPLVASFVPDPNDIPRLAAIQSAFNGTYKAFLQGKPLTQALVQGAESALIAYIVQVGVDRDFGPQFYSPSTVDFIVGQIRSTISSTISTVITPIQENILRLDPAVHRFIYGK